MTFASSIHRPCVALARSAAVLGSLFLGLCGVSSDTRAAAESALEKKGEYLSRAGNCVSCHTGDSGKAFAGGLAFETPFGTVYSTNITPDVATGIGNWTLEQFSTAMRQGERPNGEHLYPVFPYTSFSKTSDEDIEAIYAFLNTLEPVAYTAPENDLGFPFNQRWAIGLWKSLFFEEGRFEPSTGESDAWNRGAYLVQGLGHCGECHTPRNVLGGLDEEHALTGNTYLERVEGKLSSWSASNLTAAESGLAMWSETEIADYLKLGFSHRAGVFGPMNNVVVNSTRHLSSEDVGAIATYLKSLPAAGSTEASSPDEEVLRAGSIQYDIHCGTCHLPSGEGSAETGPPVLGSPVVLDKDPATLINITLYGAQLPQIAPTPEWQARTWKRMEAYANKLSDEQVAALLSYMRRAWGHEAGSVSAEQVAAQR
ncbi:MAG: cytochrome c [Pseudomonadota bacterium]